MSGIVRRMQISQTGLRDRPKSKENHRLVFGAPAKETYLHNKGLPEVWANKT